MLSKHNETKLKTDKRQKFVKLTNMWKLKNILPNNQ